MGGGWKEVRGRHGFKRIVVVLFGWGPYSLSLSLSLSICMPLILFHILMHQSLYLSVFFSYFFFGRGIFELFFFFFLLPSHGLDIFSHFSFPLSLL